ncbi:unnamed protein product [Acanthoscelides obtectus]|uniref:Integrase catalytic domain-containing protein n=1 Tax=Acanthoscelides obtectus TaxID=200917 RepID=A0A9P0K6Y7_ACAOB|nr:unnamed protein product [Acanthoscelides obtectus]CAK1666914.1 Retrovirus-related Pol polyprotein from transposon 412 [Acanthoscelides obtectus]
MKDQKSAGYNGIIAENIKYGGELLKKHIYGLILRIWSDEEMPRDWELALITPLLVSHPQSNGSIERFHATLLEMIRSHVSENPDEYPFNILPYAVQCYNSTRNKTTGFTPYELVFGHTSGRPPEHVYLEKELMSKNEIPSLLILTRSSFSVQATRKSNLLHMTCFNPQGKGIVQSQTHVSDFL